MLRDVFPQLLDGERIESATIWESSRICVTPVRGQPERSKNGVNYVLSELILGIGEVAVEAGLTQIVSVFDAKMFRVLKVAGCNPQIIGKPQRIGSAMSYAGLFGEGPLRAFRAALGIERSVLAPGAKELVFAKKFCSPWRKCAIRMAIHLSRQKSGALYCSRFVVHKSVGFRGSQVVWNMHLLELCSTVSGRIDPEAEWMVAHARDEVMLSVFDMKP
jgi:hypothetical protein